MNQDAVVHPHAVAGCAPGTVALNHQGVTVPASARRRLGRPARILHEVPEGVTVVRIDSENPVPFQVAPVCFRVPVALHHRIAPGRQRERDFRFGSAYRATRRGCELCNAPPPAEERLQLLTGMT